jgi:hypothetical protein
LRKSHASAIARAASTMTTPVFTFIPTGSGGATCTLVGKYDVHFFQSSYNIKGLYSCVF